MPASTGAGTGNGAVFCHLAADDQLNDLAPLGQQLHRNQRLAPPAVTGALERDDNLVVWVVREGSGCALMALLPASHRLDLAQSVRDEFARASIFVLPTLAGSFGLVHLEAMACGVPVITTPNCGSLVRDGVDGFVVPIRDVEALADRIEALLRDESLRMRMSARARARAASFTWSRYGEALISVLDSRRSTY